jgi:hypothetical protein
MLKDIQMKNRDNEESIHRIIAIYKLQVFLYEVSKNYWWKNWRKMLN